MRSNSEHVHVLQDELLVCSQDIVIRFRLAQDSRYMQVAHIECNGDQ
jgi:hypothetical protein